MPTELADGLGLRDAPLYSLKELEKYAPKDGSPVPYFTYLQTASLAKLLD